MKQVDTIILVSDIRKVKEFYEGIMKLDLLHDWKSMVIFKDRLAFHEKSRLLPGEIADRLFDAKGNAVIVYISTADIESEYGRLKGAGVRIIHGIVDLPWQRIFRIYDIENNVIEIGEETEG